MCRLYGFIANEPTKVDCSLVYAQNALMLQSRVDQRGVGHTDGWGIAMYLNGRPHLEKKTEAAFADQMFSHVAERTYSTTILAHIRKATVGSNSLHNTHPFVWEDWTFAHNGTLTGFSAVEPQLVDETLPHLQKMRLGQTDSEQYFFWLLSRLTSVSSSAISDSEITSLFRKAVHELDDRCRLAAPEQEPKLNFILTNGKVMFACRWNRSLYTIRREGLYDCEICGIPHIHHHETVDHQACVIASEPITNESWTKIHNKSVVAIRLMPTAELATIHCAA